MRVVKWSAAAGSLRCVHARDGTAAIYRARSASMSACGEPSHAEISSLVSKTVRPLPWRPSTTGYEPAAVSRTSDGASLRWYATNGAGRASAHASQSARRRKSPCVTSQREQCLTPSLAPIQYESSPHNVASASYTPMNSENRLAGDPPPLSSLVLIVSPSHSSRDESFVVAASHFRAALCVCGKSWQWHEDSRFSVDVGTQIPRATRCVQRHSCH